MLRLFKQYYPIRNALFVVGEGLFIFFSVFIASWILIGNDFFFADQQLVLKILLITVVCQMCLYYNNLYDLKITDSYTELLIRLMQALGAAAILLSLIYLLFPGCIIYRNVFLLSVGFCMAFIVIWRVGYTHILNRGLFDQKIFLLGHGELAKNIVHEVIDKKDCGHQFAAIIVGDENRQERISNKIPEICLKAYQGLPDFSQKMDVKKIIVAIEERRNQFPARQLLDCRVNGIEVLEGTSFYEMLTGKLIVDKINPSWLIFSEGFRKSKSRRLFKRIVDLILALVLLVSLSPVLMLTALLIKLDSKGPILFSQERVGENRKPYPVHKFRSMVDDAEKESGPVWAQCDDPRVTRVGKFIRKWRIDEFPQIFNVIKGQMSFVGPRPERAFFVKDLEAVIPYFGERFSVKPGITGWAQVNYPYGDSIEDAKEKLNYDLFYIKNMSIFMDLMVIMRTVKTVIFGEGAR